jgi:hypothetical protein
VGGGVSEIRLPVFVTFSKNVAIREAGLLTSPASITARQSSHPTFGKDRGCLNLD